MESNPEGQEVPRSSSRVNFGIPPSRYGLEGQEYVIPRPPLATGHPVPLFHSSRVVDNATGTGDANQPSSSPFQGHVTGKNSGSSILSGHSTIGSRRSAKSLLAEMKMKENDAEIKRLEQNLEAKILNLSHKMERLKLENTMLEKEAFKEELKTLNEDDDDDAQFMDSDLDMSVRNWNNRVEPHSNPFQINEGRKLGVKPIPTPRKKIHGIERQTIATDYAGQGGQPEFSPIGQDDRSRYFATPGNVENAIAPVPKPRSSRRMTYNPGDVPPLGKFGRTVNYGRQSGNTNIPPTAQPRYTTGQYGINPPAGATGGGGDALSAVDSLAQAITQALSSQNRASERFIARQSSESKLPTFAGNPLDWPLFINHYRQSTRDCGYTAAQNMGRLEKCIKGEARRSVQAMMIIPSNSDQVVAALEQRYGRPEYIIDALVNLARGTPSPKESKLASIIDYSNAISNLVITVQTMGIPEYLSNPHLLKELVDKLPDNMKIQWGEQVIASYGRPTLVQFSNWISGKAQAIGVVATPRFSALNEKKGKSADLNVVDEEVAVTEPQKEKNQFECPVCKDPNHRAPKCERFIKLDVNKKWELVKKLKLCFRCLKTGHPLSKCKSKLNCGVEDCKRSHHSLLHNHDWKRTPPQSKKDEEKAEETATIEGCSRDVLLRIVPVKLYGRNNKSIITFAIFDECSTVTLMTEALADRLELKGPTDPLRLKWTNGQKQDHNNSKRVLCQVSRENGTKQFVMKDVRTVKNLDFSPQSYKVDALVEKWPHLGLVKMPDMKEAKPQLLIGQRHQSLIVPRRIIEDGDNSPMLTNTKLGWVLHGPTGNGKGEEMTFHCEHETDEDIIHHLVKESFRLDSIGIQNYVPNLRSKEDKKAEQLMEQVTRRVGDRWETGLLWKENIIQLPESKTVALKRFYGIEKKLHQNHEMFLEYQSKILDYLKKNYAKKLTEDEIKNPSSKEWYLPHFGTFHPNKPKKLRIVFDAKSKSRGMSLNDALMTGPDLLVSLPGVLVNFRRGLTAFSGDIAEMFHQVLIRKEDQPAQRILWRSDPNQEVDVHELIVMMFGASCSPYQAQFVKNKNAKEFEKEFPEAVKAIIQRHYQDDWIDSCDDWEQAEKLIREVSTIHSKGGFQIGKWITNSPDLLERINPDATLTPKNLTEWSEIPTERVLGLHWDPEADIFTFRVNLKRAGEGIADGSRRPTKREVLRLIMLIFDPLGMISHFLVKARILLQQLWRSQIGWDDEITTDQFKKWKQWLLELKEISRVAVPRCYSRWATSADNIQLHVMADAGELAYCAIAYLRISKGNEVNVSFVMAKTRVAPLKQTSVPRLELQAALAACRLAKFLKDELDLKIHSTHYWTDSRTVLHWIRSDSRRYHQFVATRIGEIQENSDVAEWSWVPTKDNVADDGTKDGKSDLSPTSRWWMGPSFLRLPADEWPKEKEKYQLDKAELEVRKSEESMHIEQRDPDSNLPRLERFSKWTRLLRSTAYVILAVETFKSNTNVSPRLLPEHLEKAEKLLIRSSQLDDYCLEMSLLKNGKPIPKNSKLYQLSPVLDKDGILRMNARTVGVLEEGLRNPIILNPRHYLTNLIITDYHVKALHQGQDQVRNEIRQKFYVPHLRAAVKKSWSDCMECRRRRAKPLPPTMGILPDFRIQKQPRCFSICGMDYFGPLDVVVGRHHEKRYGVLFTCMNTRAVHLEVAHSLSTDSCIMAIRRFIGRRGQPKEIFSDNGTNLRGADKEIRLALEEIDVNQVNDRMTTMGIKWNFIPPSAPHFGGTWERLVKSVKTAMNVIMKSRAVKDETLQTIFVEAEAVVNSRPLTDIPVEAGSAEALTPMHFIIGSSSVYQPPGEFDDDDLDLRKQWRKSQRITDMFWKRWLREYLPTLQRRKKWHKPSQPLAKGDMVIITDENLKRNTWPLGIVTEVFPGRDGIIRVANVKTASGTYKRPVVKIARLDIKAEIPSNDS